MIDCLICDIDNYVFTMGPSKDIPKLRRDIHLFLAFYP